MEIYLVIIAYYNVLIPKGKLIAPIFIFVQRKKICLTRSKNRLYYRQDRIPAQSIAKQILGGKKWNQM